MANLESLIQAGVVTLTTVTVVFVIVRAFLAERRENSQDEAEAIADEICPHCGQNIRSDGSASGALPEDGSALHLKNVIRPAAWTGQSNRTGGTLSRWHLGLAALKRAVASTRNGRR
jgi:hypothetical protein